jgi:[CysO sulfur-carrier protein]-S-L-cysteine hydrolase
MPEDSLRLDRSARDALVAHAYTCYPEEMCGLLAGPAGASDADTFYPCGNDAASARIYSLNPRDYLRAERDAEDRGSEIIGVVHSHTHTEPYPSPTDVAQAPDPGWHYMIVSLKREAPEIRSYRIVGGLITEVAVLVS